MKKLLFILLLLPTVIFAQTDSLVIFCVQYDYYAPQESNFFMVEDTLLGDTVMFHQPTMAYQYLDTTINLNSGNFPFTDTSLLNVSSLQTGTSSKATFGIDSNI